MATVESEPATLADPQKKRWTREEYYRMGDAGLFLEERVQLIYGEILKMAPMKGPHAAGVQLAEAATRNAFGNGYCVRSQLPLFLTDESEPEPDVAVVRGGPRDYLEQHPRTALLVVEVSKSTLAFDRGTKSRLYAEAGIEDYWVVNLVDRCLEVFRQPIDGEYADRSRYEHDAEVSPLAAPGSLVKVADLLP